MIEALIKSLDPHFLNIEWLEVYGGLVETITRKVGTAEENSDEAFPVTLGTNMEDCGEECLQKLYPDDSKRALAFWVLQGEAVPSQPKNISRANGMVSLSQTARLIVWLNFTGCDDCNAASYLPRALELTNYLNRLRVESSDPVGAAGRIKITGVPVRNYLEVFGTWTYGTNQRLFTYPFDFFAVDCTFEWLQNNTCPTLPVC